MPYENPRRIGDDITPNQGDKYTVRQGSDLVEVTGIRTYTRVGDAITEIIEGTGLTKPVPTIDSFSTQADGANYDLTFSFSVETGEDIAVPDSFQASYDDGIGFSSSVTVTSPHTFQDITPGIHRVRVRAIYDGSPSFWRQSASIDNRDQPAPSVNSFTSSPDGSTFDLTLAWSIISGAQYEPPIGYNVEVRVNGGAWTTETDVSALSYVFQDEVPGTYRARVRSVFSDLSTSAWVESDDLVVAAAWSPTDLTGLQLWADAQDGANISTSGGQVAVWSDNSGNDNDLLQSTAAARPSYNNSDPTDRWLEFDGVDEFLQISGDIVNGTNPAVTIAFLLRFTNISGSSGTLRLAQISTGTGNCVSPSVVNNDQLDWQYNNGNRQFSATLTNDTDYILVFRRTANQTHNNASSTVRLNGTSLPSIGSSNPSNSVDLSGAGSDNILMLGKGVFATSTDVFIGMEIRSLVITESLVALADVERLEGYLTHRYGKASILPANHTYKSAPP